LVDQDNCPVGVLCDVALLLRLETGGVELDRHWFLVCLETFSSRRTHLVRGPRWIPDDVDISPLDTGYLLDHFLDLMTQVSTGWAAHSSERHTNLHSAVIDCDTID